MGIPILKNPIIYLKMKEISHEAIAHKPVHLCFLLNYILLIMLLKLSENFPQNPHSLR